MAQRTRQTLELSRVIERARAFVEQRLKARQGRHPFRGDTGPSDVERALERDPVVLGEPLDAEPIQQARFRHGGTFCGGRLQGARLCGRINGSVDVGLAFALDRRDNRLMRALQLHPRRSLAGLIRQHQRDPQNRPRRVAFERHLVGIECRSERHQRFDRQSAGGGVVEQDFIPRA